VLRNYITTAAAASKMVPIRIASHMTDDGDDRSTGGGDFSRAVFVPTCRRLLPQVTITILVVIVVIIVIVVAAAAVIWCVVIFTTTVEIPVARSRYPELCSTAGRPVETSVPTCTYVPLSRMRIFIFLRYSRRTRKNTTHFFVFFFIYTGRRGDV